MRQTVFKFLRRAAGIGVVAAGGLAATVYMVDRNSEKQFADKMMNIAHLLEKDDMKNRSIQPLPSRNELIKSQKETPIFDVLVIGGGATGAGVALDSQTRGLQTALVEYDDYSSGTSSRSTKLIHGGVRYLQSAILKLDIEQYRMVKEALFERANMLEAAPHLSYPLPIMLPIYKWWQAPYFWAGIKAYDFVSGRKLLKSSYFISKSKALELFPMLKKDKLVGALIYYDVAAVNLGFTLVGVVCMLQERFEAVVRKDVKMNKLTSD